MANNCLVTKLKRVVDNDSLLKIADIKMHVSTTSLVDYNKTVGVTILNTDIMGNTIQVPVIKGIGGKIIVNNVEYDSYTMTLSDVIYNVSFDVENKDYDIIIENAKYALLSLTFADNTTASLNKPQIVHFDASQLNFCNIRWFLCSNQSGEFISGEFKPYNASSVYGIECANGLAYSNPMSMDIDKLQGSTNLSKIVIGQTYNSIGDILSLSANKTITRISIPNTKITGDVDSFATAQVTTGRTSGSATIEATNTAITCSVISANKIWRIDYDSSYTGGYLIVAL